MRNPDHFEIAIIGGGPAGICAAIRLLSFGRSVALIESEIFPRRQIGEHLSPGIWNIFNFLNADHILAEQPAYLRGLPARIIWNDKNKQQAITEHNQTIMVDRSSMDKDLLDIAIKLGLALFQPADVESCERTTIGWKVNIQHCKETRKLTSTLIIDARGHRGINAVNKISMSPRSVALWIETRRPVRSDEVILEAVDNGWLWGSPLPNNNFRIMAMVDAKELSRQRPNSILGKLLKKSNLLGREKIESKIPRVEACLSQSYFHSMPWQNNYVRLGESAFSIDPLSSTGVEKAMRFSLQATVAINHFLKSGDEQVSRLFYEDRLVESVVTHSAWAQGFYSQAWAKGIFWQDRSRFDIHEESSRGMLFVKVSSKLAGKKQSEFRVPRNDLNFGDVQDLWNEKIRISDEVKYPRITCAVNDELEEKQGVGHPCLEREIVYWNDVEIASLLLGIRPGQTLGGLANEWGKTMPVRKSVQLLSSLWTAGIICPHHE